MGLTARALPWALGALLAALAAGAWWIDHRAYERGEAAAEARLAAELKRTQERLFRTADALAARAAELEAARAAREDLARSLEDEAREDPRAHERLPSDDSLRRLRRRWGAQD